MNSLTQNTTHNRDEFVQLNSQPEEPTPSRQQSSAKPGREFFSLIQDDSGCPIGSLVNDLASFSVRYKLGRDGCNELFRILIAHGVKGLPRDCRSAKHSIRKVEVQPFDVEGSYYHFGLSKYLTHNLSLLGKIDSQVLLQFNFDGLPIHNSSKLDFWPILCRATAGCKTTNVFMVGLYCGKSKPHNVHQYLSQFVDDCLVVLQEGVDVAGQTVSVKIDAFICDAPARQYIKRITSCSGYGGCERCVIHGIDDKGVKFLSIDHLPRTDELFRAKKYSPYHQNKTDDSPLMPLPIDFVSDFPLDYMHLVLQGVVRRLVYLWYNQSGHLTTSYSSFHRLDTFRKNQVESRVKICSESISSEFDRKPRSFLDEMKNFKAKEFRTLLCYTFPFLFKDIFPVRVVYDHFLVLCVSFRILLSKDPIPEIVDYVRSLIRSFVVDVQKYYGKAHMIYNTHSLSHIVDDYEKYGILDKISAFPFENYLQKLKNYVRRPGKELQQVVKRIHEESFLDICAPVVETCSVVLSKPHNRGPSADFDDEALQFDQALYKSRKFGTDNRNCFVYSKGKVARIVNFIRDEDKLYTLVNFCTECTSYFSYPCDSRKVGIYLCSEFSDEIEMLSLEKVEKCTAFPLREGYYVAKLLHETV